MSPRKYSDNTCSTLYHFPRSLHHTSSTNIILSHLRINYPTYRHRSITSEFSNPKTRRYKSFYVIHGTLQGLKPSLLSPNALPTDVSDSVTQNLLHAKWRGTKAVSPSKLAATARQLDRQCGCAQESVTHKMYSPVTQFKMVR